MATFKRIIKRIGQGLFLREAEEGISTPQGVVWPITDGVRDTSPVATVYRCIRVLSQGVASLPLRKLDRQPDGTWREDTGSRLAYLLGIEPMPRMSAFDFWRQAEQQVQTHGDAFIWPKRNEVSGELEFLLLFTPMSVKWDWVNQCWDANDQQYGIRRKFDERELVHIMNYSVNGIEGMSTLEMARRSIEIARHGDRETAKRFKSGGNVRGFLTNQPGSVQGYNTYSNKALKEAAAEKDVFFQSGGNITFIPGAAHFQQLVMSSTDMQFLETRKFSVVEICRFFGVPPSFAFADTATNYKSAENSSMDFLNYALNPILTQIENALRRVFFPREEEALNSRFEFDRSKLMQCDLETTVRWQQLRIQAGLDTINEARLRDNSSPVEHGDTVLVSANLKSLGETINDKR